MEVRPEWSRCVTLRTHLERVEKMQAMLRSLPDFGVPARYFEAENGLREMQTAICLALTAAEKALLETA